MATVAVLNAGGWGTAIAVLLARHGHGVRLWARRRELADALTRTRVNETYLPGVVLGPTIAPTADLAAALDACDVVVAVPISRAMADLARQMAPHLPDDAAVVHGTKGFEHESLARMSEIIERELRPTHHGRVAALSGPTHAEEVGRGIPTAAVVASLDADTSERLQQIFTGPTFRVYRSTDVIGVELCGALKNVVALAAGIGDGLGGGDNAKAALMTRSLAEIGRLVVAAGGQITTVAGLAGIGDLIATCTSQLSRNRRAGQQIGRGATVEAAIGETRQVVEGVPATRAAIALSRRYGVTMPIAEQLHAVLFENRDPRRALADLMARDPTVEQWGGLP